MQEIVSGDDTSVSVTGSVCNHVRRMKDVKVFRLKLGIVWVDGQIKNHRSLLKVVCNPVLRIFGWQITTVFQPPYSEPSTWKVKLSRTEPRNNLLANFRDSWVYDGRYDFIQKERRLW